MEINEIVKKVQEGDDFAVGQLYEELKGKSISIAKQHLAVSDDAEDMYQEAFIKALDHIEEFDISKNFSSWFNVILVNTCKDYMRKKDNSATTQFSAMSERVAGDSARDGDKVFENTLENQGKYTNPEEILDAKALKQIMGQIIDGLPDNQKESLMLFYYKEMSVKDIAKTLDISENTVKSRLNYARKKVGEEVESYEKKNGIKLRSVGAIPLLLLFLHSQEGAQVAGQVLATIKGIGATTTSIAGGLAARTNEKVASGAATKAATSAATKAATGAGATNAATKAAAGAGAKKGILGAIQAFFKKIWATTAGKVATGLVVAGAVGAGATLALYQQEEPQQYVFAGYNYNQSSDDYLSTLKFTCAYDEVSKDDNGNFIANINDRNQESYEDCAWIAENLDIDKANEYFEENKEEYVQWIAGQAEKYQKTVTLCTAYEECPVEDLDLTNDFPDQVTLQTKYGPLKFNIKKVTLRITPNDTAVNEPGFVSGTTTPERAFKSSPYVKATIQGQEYYVFTSGFILSFDGTVEK